MSQSGRQAPLFSQEERETPAPQSLIKRYAFDGLGLLLIALSLITLLALFGFSAGSWLMPWVSLWRRLLGWGAALVVVGLAFAGWQILASRNRPDSLTWARVISLELAAISLLGVLSVIGGHSLERAELGRDGGIVGWGLIELLQLSIGRILPDWLTLTLGGLLFVALFAIAFLYSLSLLGKAPSFVSRMQTGAIPEPVLAASDFSSTRTEPEAGKMARRSSRVPKEFRQDLAATVVEQPSGPTPDRKIDLPPFDLLTPEKSMRSDEKYINQRAGLLVKTLSEFGIPAKVVGYKVGPTVTQFALEPGYLDKKPGEEVPQKVRVSQISALQRDLALALSAQRLRIQAPVPGRSYVGVEIPNTKAHTVRLRTILESHAFQSLQSPLAIALGRDVAGAPLAADLSKMPHLLIAGTTGSGKSVLITAITAALAMNNHPDDLKLIMLDPKMVELLRYNGLPHLLGEVETNLDRITAVLRWVVAEMQRRYKMLEQERVRDLDKYNQKVSTRKDGKTMPRIVVLIDELADLMMSAAEHTESTLVRLAQMARAVGIHLVVATQRPSTDVVTGLIKANFPARISFAVSSSIDSRVILDHAGAEALLGRGDMLYLSPEAPAPKRSQGVMVTDNEIDAIIKYWQEQVGDQEATSIIDEQPDEEAPWDEMIKNDSVLADRDELVEDAIREIRASGKSSASHLQRALRIGYPRAARLVDELEDMGILGALRTGGKEREILISTDEEDDEPFS